jgi:hypothetical protein
LIGNLEPNCYPIVGPEYGPFGDLRSVPEARKKKSEKQESEFEEWKKTTENR